MKPSPYRAPGLDGKLLCDVTAVGGGECRGNLQPARLRGGHQGNRWTGNFAADMRANYIQVQTPADLLSLQTDVATLPEPRGDSEKPSEDDNQSNEAVGAIEKQSVLNLHGRGEPRERRRGANQRTQREPGKPTARERTATSWSCQRSRKPAFQCRLRS